MRLGLIENAWWGSPVSTLKAVELTKAVGFDVYDLMPQKELTPPKSGPSEESSTTSAYLVHR